VNKYFAFGVILTVFIPAVSLAQTVAFQNNLYYGITGSTDVTALQEFLTGQGVYRGPVSGNFFSLTLAGVKKFQAAEGVTPVSGYFGPITRGVANTILADEIGSNSEGNATTTQAPVDLSQTDQASTTYTPTSPTGYVCPSGYSGTYPNCVAEQCPQYYAGAYPDCVPLSCPSGTIGTYPYCNATAAQTVSQSSLSISLGQVTVGTDSAYLSWTMSIPANSKVFLTTNATSPQLFPSSAGYSTQGFVNISNLTPNTQYAYTIEATNGTQDQKLIGTLNTAALSADISAIQNADIVSSQNIAVNVPNQPLGGFQTTVTGDTSVPVQSLTIHFALSNSATAPLTNVSLVDQNGNVKGGPYNAMCASAVANVANVGTTQGHSCDTDYQFVTFSNVTFPAGNNTYIIEGQVPTDAINGETVQASTNPSYDWSPVSSVTPLSMNTMTVRTAALTVSNSMVPTSETIAAGSNNVPFAGVQLDASQSAENVRLSSLPMTLTTTGSPSNLSNCQVWNGSTALNTGSYVVNSSDITGNSSPYSATFSFNNSLTIPKGTDVVLTLECNVSSSAANDATYQWSVDSNTNDYSATGAVSGTTVPVTVSSTPGPIISTQS
jgi:hypothetical protein